MCEPSPDGARGPPPSTGASPHEPHEPHKPPSRDCGWSSPWFPLVAATNTSTCVTSPLELISSLRAPQAIDMLMNQLETQSLRQSITGASLTSPQISGVLSPPSLPDDHVLHCLPTTEAMLVDTEMEEVWEAPAPRPLSHTYTEDRVRESRSKSILAMIASETQCTVHPPPPRRSLTPMIPEILAAMTLEEQSQEADTEPAIPAEVDEGYCEDDDDFSWLGTGSNPSASSSMACTTGGVSKMVRFRYRTSAETARNCPNVVHSVVRMRRRDGTKRKKKSRSQGSGTNSASKPSET